MYVRVLLSDCFSMRRSSLLISIGVLGITTAALTPDPSEDGMPKDPCPWSIQHGILAISKASEPSGVEVYRTFIPIIADMGFTVRGNISAFQAPVAMTITSASRGFSSSIGFSDAYVVTSPRFKVPPARLNKSMAVMTQRCAISNPASGSKRA